MTGAKRPRILQLNVRSLRGIVDLELKLEAKGVVLQGANGQGKSSVVDALEFVLLGAISHLEGKQTLSLAKHGKHVAAKDADVRVELQFNDGGKLTRRLAGGAVAEGSAQAYERDAQRRTFLLRRSQLLAFIHADPADRFRELAALIGIGRLDGLELALKRTTDALKGTLDADVLMVRSREADLKLLTGLDPATLDEAGVLKFVNSRLTELQRPEVASLTAAGVVAASFVDPVVVSVKTRELIATEAAQAGITELSNQTQALTRVDGAIARIAAFRERGEARRGASLSILVQDGERYIAEYAPSECPVCEQPIDTQALGQRLKVRQQELRELTDEASALRTDAATLSAELKDLAAGLSTFLAGHTVLVDANTATQLQNTVTVATTATTLLDAKDILSDGKLPVGCQAEHGAVARALATLEIRLAKRAESLKPSAQERAAAGMMQEMLRIQGLVIDRELASAKVRRGTELTKRAKVALAELVAAKKEVVADIYNAIKGDVDRLYGYLHPGEPHGNIVLDVSRRASTMLWMDSFGVSQQDPRGFSSEGHLDSLGLCIFLAFANTFSRGL